MSNAAGTRYPRAVILERMLVLAEEAGRIVMDVYRAPFDVEYKGRNDPVTVADKRANAHIVTALGREFAGIPVVAEESDPSAFAGFEAARSAFFVDPLDGTREFVAKNGQFAVMIGLAEDGRATAGVVVCPALGRTFAATPDGAFEVKSGARSPIHVTGETALSQARVVVSRSHRSADADDAIRRIGGKVDHVGSAGVKGALVACGEAEVYVQPGLAGKRWDSCAPEAIVRAAGGSVSDTLGRAIDYKDPALDNRHGLVMTCGPLHAAVLARLSAKDSGPPGDCA